MFVVEIKRGNAVEPYRTLMTQRFHTELAALLFGAGECAAQCALFGDRYCYWSVARAD